MMLGKRFFVMKLYFADDVPEFSSLPPGDFGAAFAKMFLALAVVILLMVLTVWMIKRLIQHRLQRGVGEQAIQILEKRMISAKTTLYLIEVDKKSRVLVAESHLEIKRLETLPAEPIPSESPEDR
jgi:flagellar biogenesis protein FliO